MITMLNNCYIKGFLLVRHTHARTHTHTHTLCVRMNTFLFETNPCVCVKDACETTHGVQLSETGM